jgi:hypothetical protein
VTVFVGGVARMNEVRSGGSYISQNDLRLHFGLGAESKMNKIVVRWPSGKEEELNDVTADAIYTVTEGSGITRTVALPAIGAK